MMRRFGGILAVVVALALAAPGAADAQRRRKRHRQPKPEPKPAPAQVEPPEDDGAKGPVKDAGRAAGGNKAQLFDFEGLNLDGSTRMPQLLYFLDRANEELSRASLERRSFVPAMVRSVDEEGL